MIVTAPGRLAILSGPSCVGKTPLVSALGRLHPKIRHSLRKIVLHNTRAPRPRERDGIDYHFRRRDQVEALRRDPRFLVLEARGDLQAVDLEELLENLGSGDVLFEGNPIVACALLEEPRLATVRRLAVFVSPLSRDEIVALRAPGRAESLEEYVGNLMRGKLLRRIRRQHAEIVDSDLDEIARRAGNAYREMQQAWRFDYVIPNHEGEDSEDWDALPDVRGDARRAVNAFASLVEGREPPGVEHWERDLLP